VASAALHTVEEHDDRASFKSGKLDYSEKLRLMPDYYRQME
jgi:hypothetical protein